MSGGLWCLLVNQAGSVEQEIGKKAGANVGLCRYFYGDDAAALATESESRWRDWLSKTFPGG